MAETGEFGGARVTAFESRRRAEMEALLRSYGADPCVAPAVCEVPSDDPSGAEGVRRLLAGELDVLVLLTAGGARRFLELAESTSSRDEVLGALSRITTVVRGPKPFQVLAEWGLLPTLTVPEPATWREVVETLESDPRGSELPGARVALQESGEPNAALVRALEEAGASVIPLRLYRWELPEDRAPLLEALEELGSGASRIALFTSGVQAEHLFRVAEETGKADGLRAALRKGMVASIGPSCSRALERLGVPPDLEASQPKMEVLVAEAAAGWRRVQAGKTLPRPQPRRSEPRPPNPDAAFLRACRREPTPHTPIWLMRQAGRYMAEYRELRARHSFLELCKRPELVAEVTVTAAERLGVDAAILFADILLIVEPLGLQLEYSAGDGPVISPTVRCGADVDRLREVDPAALDYVYQGVRLTRAALHPDIPLIGFCGAPFTVASYVIEGGGSRNYEHTKTLMFRDPGAWHALMERIVRGLAAYVNGQVAAGAQAIQLFDSWVGCLGQEDYREFGLPHSRALIQAVAPGVPVIHFGTGTPSLLPLLREAGGDVIGIDWRIELDEAWERVGYDRAVQGNLDPLVLFAEPAYVKARAERVLRQAGGRPGHIFNLGHGILPRTPVDHVLRLVEWVHGFQPPSR